MTSILKHLLVVLAEFPGSLQEEPTWADASSSWVSGSPSDRRRCYGGGSIGSGGVALTQQVLNSGLDSLNVFFRVTICFAQQSHHGRTTGNRGGLQLFGTPRHLLSD